MKPYLKILSIFIFLSCVSISYTQNLPIHPKKIKEAFERTSNIRGLKAKAAILDVKTKDEVKRYVLKRFKEEYPSKELELERRSLVAFGLLDDGFPYRDFLLSFLTSQIAGYYDQAAKVMNLADWLKGELQLPTLAHEYTHLLEDSNFDLKKFIKRDKENDDLTLARTALLEGDATYTMMEYVLAGSGLKEMDQISMRDIIRSQMQDLSAFGLKNDTPAFLIEALLFPYIAGFDFVWYLKTKGGWEKVNEAFKTQPLSTEQIMHPEKYPKEIPARIELNGPGIKKRCKEIKRNVLGEFFIYLVLKNGIDEESSKKAAQGWGGDSYVLCERQRDGNDPLIFHSVFDSEKEAKEFFDAYSNLLAKRYPDNSFDKGKIIVRSRMKNGPGTVLRIQGNGVFIAQGFDEGALGYFEDVGIGDIANIKNEYEVK